MKDSILETRQSGEKLLRNGEMETPKHLNESAPALTQQLIQRWKVILLLHTKHTYETNGSMCRVVGKSQVSASTVDAWCPGRDGKCQVTETPRRKYTKLQQSGTRGYVTRTVSLLLTPVTCEELAVVRVTHSLN